MNSTEEERWNKHADRHSVSASLRVSALDHFSVAVAEMSWLDAGDLEHLINGSWWVNRVLVRRPQHRGHGFGSRVLQEALSLAVKQQPGSTVQVCPGGYYGDTDRQFAFYLKNGFRRVEWNSEILVWGS